MYKLWNFIFGWDYIHWSNTADQGVARVLRLPDGRVAYWQYRITSLLVVLEHRDEVTWLTCCPRKYGL